MCFIWSSTRQEPTPRNICCSEEPYVHRIDTCDSFLFVFLRFACSTRQPAVLLEWDKPQCFPSSTLSTTGFPAFRDLSAHSCTCFLSFSAPLLPCLLVRLYLQLSLSQFILLLFFCPPSSSDRPGFPSDDN